MTSAPPFKIAIVGGGIGGLVTALSIHHHCIESSNPSSDKPQISITVYEQASAYKEIGAGVGIGYNAAKLLHRLGMGDKINAIAGNRQGVWISFQRYDNGEILTMNQPQDDVVRGVGLHRAEFLDVLIETIQERGAAELLTKKCCRGAKEDGDKMLIEFVDDATAVADLVIGCDGIHSALRAQFITDNPRYSGLVAYRGLVPIEKLECLRDTPTYSLSWLGQDKHFLAFPISQNRLLNIVAFVSTAEEELLDMKESWIAAGDRIDLERHFQDFPKPVKEIIEHMPINPSKWKLNDRYPLEQWMFANGKVILMGDAAHAMLPFQGAGAGQAIEDGYIIGRALHDYFDSEGEKHDLRLWGQLYQDVRLPRAQKVAQTSREAGKVYEMQTDDMKDKTYEECVPLVRNHLKDRMKWIWGGSIEDAYVEKKAEAGLT